MASLANVLATLLFSVLCLAGAAMVFKVRQRGTPDSLLLMFGWPMLLSGLTLSIILTGDQQSHYGTRLTLAMHELRVPLQDDGRDGVRFIVGPRAVGSDLIVGPYADAQASEEAYRVQYEGLLTIGRYRGEWQACAHSVEAEEEANLPGMRVSLGGNPAPAGNPRLTCRLLNAGALDVEIERENVLGPSDDESGRFSIRRHLRIVPTRDAISVMLRPDETLNVYWGRCSDTPGTGPEALRLAPAGLHQRDLGYRVPENLVFSQLGQGGERPLLDPALLGPIADIGQLCEMAPATIAWPESGPQARLVGTASATSIGWWIAGLVLLSSIWTVLACRPYWHDAAGRNEASVVIALQWLLTLRLLMAMAGLANDPRLTQAGILLSPAVAFACVPLLAVALLRPHERSTPALALLALQLPLAVALALWCLDWPALEMQEMVLIGSTLALLIWRGWSRQNQPLMLVIMLATCRLTGWFSVALAGLVARWRSHWQWVERWHNVSRRMMVAGLTGEGRSGRSMGGVNLVQVAYLVAVILLFTRSGLAIIFNVKERFSGIPVISNLPLSLIHVPISIIVMAILMSAYRKIPTLSGAILLAATFGALFPIVGLVVRDFGTIFIFGLSVGWAIGGLMAYRPSVHAWLARVVLGLPLILPLALIVAYFSLFAKEVPPPADDLEGHLAASAQWNRNLVRLQALLDADELVDIGNRYSFQMLEQAAQIGPITSNYFGQGYMAPSGVVPPVLNYQYSDNLLAVLVTWPFGRIGLVVLLLSLAYALMAMRTGPPEPDRSHWKDDAARMAALIMFWSGAYMALANLNLVPFTGRNFYLLSPRSLGDLAEGMVLLFLIALPFAVEKPVLARSGPGPTT